MIFLTEEGVDGEAVSCLTDDSLKSLVTRIGPRMKLNNAIKKMNAGSTSSDSQSDSTSAMLSSQSWQDDTPESCGSSLSDEVDACQSAPPSR